MYGKRETPGSFMCVFAIERINKRVEYLFLPLGRIFPSIFVQALVRVGGLTPRGRQRLRIYFNKITVVLL
jgi:hypothetical protein